MRDPIPTLAILVKLTKIARGIAVIVIALPRAIQSAIQLAMLMLLAA
ncbi:MAG: hypothetical protein Q8N60_03215 [Candidatus Diapherotrites archaeon]|nr:hypothetical protein [Candidatus Diapherotrites archaeon]